MIFEAEKLLMLLNILHWEPISVRTAPLRLAHAEDTEMSAQLLSNTDPPTQLLRNTDPR